MGYNKVTIDVEARFIDNLTAKARAAGKAVDDLDKKAGRTSKDLKNAGKGASSAAKDIDKLDKSAEKAGKKLDAVGKKKAKPSIDADTSKISSKLDSVDKKVGKIGKSKASILLNAKDEATKLLDKALSAAKKFANKTYSAAVKVRDSNVLSTLSKVGSRLQSFTGKTWTTMVKIKDYATAPLTKLKNLLFSIKSLVLAITAGLAAKTLVMNPVSLADTYAGALAGFKTQLGDQGGQAMMDQLQAFAAKTPFDATGVIQNATSMLAQGFDADTMIDNMRIIGDAAASTGQMSFGMERIMRAISQIKTAGTVQGDEMNQLAEAGIPAYQILAEEMGYSSIAEYRKAQKGGNVSSDAAIEALLSGMQKRYSGMMEKLSTNTFSGVWSNIMDTMKSDVWLKWGQGLQSGGIKALTKVTELLDSSEGKLKKLGDTLYEVGQSISDWAAGKFENTMNRLMKILDSEEFASAGLGGKFKMLWDGLIADPVKEWWEGGGQQKTADTMGKIGAWMGKTLSTILLGLFGATDVLNEGIGEDAGSNIAGAFLRGFLDNFDGAAITQAFIDAVGNVWGALPTWAKMLVGGIGAGKVAGGLSSAAGMFTNLAGGAKKLFGGAGLGTILGDTGTAMVAGSGLKGLLANIGYGVTGGAAGSTLSGAAAAGIGAGTVGAVAGGLYGGFTAGRGIYDIYHGVTNNDKTQTSQGILRTGGTATGAGIGAAIGTVIMPGIGTAIGAGIGAGAGALAGNFGAKKMGEYEAAKKSIEELTKESVKSAEAADELAKRQEDAAKIIDKAFGDVELTMEDIQSIAKNVTLGDHAQAMNTFTAAVENASTAVSNLETSSENLNKMNWKASLGFTFDEVDKESYLAAIDNYISSAEQVVESQHYQFKAAVDLLIDPESDMNQSITKSADAWYGKLQEQLDATSADLKKQVNIALEDGKIDANEQEIIAQLQSKISEITEKVAQAESEAKLEALKIKFSSGNIDYESFQKLQAELQTQIEEATSNYDKALETSITSLKLQLDDGAISQSDYDAQIKALTEGYEANVGEIQAKAEGVQLEVLGDAFEDVLGEDSMAKLQSALESSINDGIKPINWTPEQAANYLGVESLTGGAATAIGQALQSVADTLPEQNVPVGINPEYEVEHGGSSGTLEEKLKPQEQYNFNTTANVNPVYNIGGSDGSVKGAVAGAADTMIRAALQPQSSYNFTTNSNINSTYSTNKFEGSKSEFGVNDSYSFPTATDIVASYKANKFNGSKSTFGIKDSYNFSTRANVTVNWSYTNVGKKENPAKQARGGLVGPNGPKGFSSGGMVRGGAQLITVAEEGSPEMIIPMSSQRRGRALKLWAQAGHMMGVPGFARGGMTNGQDDEGIRFSQYGADNSAGGQTVQVDVGGVSVDIHVDGGEPANIVEEIKAQSSEIVDTIAGILADAFEGQFANTPSRGGAY